MRFTNNTMGKKVRRNFVCVSHPKIGRCVGKIPSEAAKRMFLKLCKQGHDEKDIPITLTLRETYTHKLHCYCCILQPTRPGPHSIKRLVNLKNVSVFDADSLRGKHSTRPHKQFVRKFKSKKKNNTARKFVCVFPPGLGIYTGRKPSQAARKALTGLRKNHGLEEGDIVKLVLRETNTRTFYDYSCTVKTFAVPKRVSCNGVNICFKHQSMVRLISRTRMNHLCKHDYSKMLERKNSEIASRTCVNDSHTMSARTSTKETNTHHSKSSSEHVVLAKNDTPASSIFENWIMKYLPY